MIIVPVMIVIVLLAAAAALPPVQRRVDRRDAQCVDADGVVEVILVRSHFARGEHRDGARMG